MRGLTPFAERIAEIVEEIARSKKGPRDRRRRLIAALQHVLCDVHDAGVEAAMIVVRDKPEAVNAIVAAKAALPR